ncbi:MAG: hypothetical protein WCF97_08850 [Nitrososphaeraceae archaeon]
MSRQITRKVLQDIISTGTSTGFESYPFDPTNARYVIIKIKHPGTTSITAQISEIKVFSDV